MWGCACVHTRDGVCMYLCMCVCVVGGGFQAVSNCSVPAHLCLRLGWPYWSCTCLPRYISSEALLVTRTPCDAQACLGVRARQTGRADNLAQFIRTGADTTRVFVTICNTGPDAYEHDM